MDENNRLTLELPDSFREQEVELHLYFHPWEFTSLDRYATPWYIKSRSGDPLKRQLDLFIQNMKKKARFTILSEFLDGQD